MTKTGFPLFRLRLLRWKRSLLGLGKQAPLKTLVMVAMGVLLLSLETLFFHRMFGFLFREIEPPLHIIAEALSLQILQLLFLVFFVMLIYSNLVTSISVYLIARDMQAFLVWPVGSVQLFLHKFLETLARSSIALMVFALPALITYGMAREAGGTYYLFIPIGMTLFVIIPTAIAVPIMLVLARCFPTKRLQQGLIALGLLTTTIGLFAFRLMRLEEIFSQPGENANLMVWANRFSLPDWSWFPSSWLVHGLAETFESPGGVWPWMIRLAIAAAGTTVIGTGLGAALLRSTWSRSFAVPRRDIRKSRFFSFEKFRFPMAGRDDSAMILKEIKVFSRDLARWSQLIMMIPLIGFYLVNLYLLPFREHFGELYYLINLFMIAFMVSAIGARYLFPSISWEGPALWMVRVSPYSAGRLVAIKFVFLSIPLVLLTFSLVFLSFWMLDFPWRHLITSLVMAMETTLLFSALAVGLGALLPRFRYEHHLEISLGPGGILYMILTLVLSASYLLVLALPVFTKMQSSVLRWENWPLATIQQPDGFALQVWTLLCIAGCALSLGVGAMSLAKREDFDR